MELWLYWKKQNNNSVTVKVFSEMLFDLYEGTVNRLFPIRVTSSEGAYYEYSPSKTLETLEWKKVNENLSKAEKWAIQNLVIVSFIKRGEVWSIDSDRLVSKRIFMETVMLPVIQYINPAPAVNYIDYQKNNIIIALKLGILNGISEKNINKWYDEDYSSITIGDAFQIIENVKKVLREHQNKNNK